MGVGDKAARGAARQRVAAYHQARLEELVGHVAVAVDGWRAGSFGFAAQHITEAGAVLC